MLSHILMRQNATRCFGQIFQGAGGQISQTPLMRIAALTSATQSVNVPHLTTVPANSMLLAPVQSQPTQRWLTTLQQKPINQTSQSLGIRAMSTNHPKIWAAEKVVSLVMVPALIVPLIWTTPLTDAIFCTLCVLHSHWGIEAIVVDYIRPALFGGSTVIPNIAQALVWALSAFTLGALYYFAYTDVGIINAIKMLWKV